MGQRERGKENGKNIYTRVVELSRESGKISSNVKWKKRFFTGEWRERKKNENEDNNKMSMLKQALIERTGKSSIIM